MDKNLRPSPFYNQQQPSVDKTTTQSPFMNNTTTSTQKDDIIKKEYERLKQYNCSKNYLKLTTEKIPYSSSILQDSYIPIGLMINSISATETELPLVNFGNNPIPRCVSCRAYINPFVTWKDNGNFWVCNLCKKENQTPDYYYCGINNYTNERTDLNQRPELSNGSVEFFANQDYMRRPPMAPAFYFIIDVSIASIQNKFLYAVIESIKDIINTNALNNYDRTKVAIITYDTNIHFYNLNVKSNQNQMLVISEEDLFLPTVEDNLIVNLKDSRNKILQLLDTIPTLFSNTNCKDSNKLFGAVKAAKMLARNNGGKFLIFNASVSVTSTPFIKKGTSNLPSDEAVLTPSDDKQVCKLGVDLTNENICCELFIAAETYCNLITLNELATFTNGNIHFYKNFRIDTQYKCLYNQIRKTLTNKIAWEAVIRTRFSTGWRVSNFITPVLISNDDLMVMPSLDSDQNYLVSLDFNINKNIPNSTNSQNNIATFEDNFFFIQSALLFSHSDGTRRIRVHNLCLPITYRLTDFFESVEVESLAIYFLKLTVANIFKTKKISSTLIQTEQTYKNIIASCLSAQQSLQKQLPQSLLYLPLYILGIMKNRVCCKDEISMKFDTDLSNFLRIKILKYKFYDILPFIYPRIYVLNDLLSNDSIGEYDENGDMILPNVINSYYSSFENDGIYLIDNGYLFIIYIRMNANRDLLQSFFGVNDVKNINLPIFEDNFFDNCDNYKQKLLNIIEYFRYLKSVFQNLFFCFEGTDSEIIIKEYLVEDNLCKWYQLDYNTFYKNTVETKTSFRQVLK